MPCVDDFSKDWAADSIWEVDGAIVRSMDSGSFWKYCGQRWEAIERFRTNLPEEGQF